MKIQELQARYAKHPMVKALGKALGNEKNRMVNVEGLLASSAPLAFSALKVNRPFLFILQDAEEAGYFYHDLTQVLGTEQVLFFPSSYRRSVKYAQRDAANEILRTEVLARVKGIVKSEKFAAAVPSAEGTAAANSSLFTLHSSLGIDFVCFDAEDWGTPQWAETAGSDGDTWALGAQYWAEQYAAQSTKVTQHSTLNTQPTYRYGILLDMVGGEGARFYQEGVSLYYAPKVVRKVWDAARVAGFASFFPKDEGNNITDDHLPVNQKAKIPCIDIIPHYPDCEASSFGPTWHTVNDNMQHIDRHTLQAVGQTLIQVLFSEQ